MQINWCIKGIRGGPSFGDTEALSVMNDTGIQSNWLRVNASMPVNRANIAAQQALNLMALDSHVNDYGAVGATSPYISLSAGCREFIGSSVPTATYPAYRTALEFATDWGSTFGYLYRCWVITAPQIAADVMGIADEVRDLNIFADFYQFHYEGEIAAKIVVPTNQIQWVQKVESNLLPASWSDGHGSRARKNSNFRQPQTISNLISELK
ncbi:hypothetical protein [Methylobacterium sp. XJLW]|uniref:hypothetical protein n=1 Tax=Methylobacterium sp. XJLW TaxID=739141 RepID=UPI000F55107B|nr:hypothetical protein [Methylobacterium sp. XJLW]